MASLPNSKIVTYEEWLRMPIVKHKEEVVNGEIRTMPPPNWKHGEIVDNLGHAIRTQVDRREVTVASSLFGLVIRKSPLTFREPDLAVFRKSTIVEKDGYIHSAPDLVVEVLSPANTRAERAVKAADYASLGIPEFWEFSAEERKVEVWYLENGQYRRHATLTEGVLTPLRFPNVHIDLASIWPE